MGIAAAIQNCCRQELDRLDSPQLRSTTARSDDSLFKEECMAKKRKTAAKKSAKRSAKKKTAKRKTTRKATKKR